MCLAIICFTDSCNVISTKGDFSEVDFSKEVKVNIEYNFEVFEALISYDSGCLNFKYSENCGAMSNTEVTINAQAYSFSNNELNFTGNSDKLNDNFLPLIIYNLLSENNGRIVTQMFDERKQCYYFEESVSNIFFRFEIYESNNKYSYCIVIT